MCGLCGFARAEAGNGRLAHVIRSDYTRGGDGETGKELKNHDLMTDCVMMGWIVAVTRQRGSETRVLFPHSTTMMMFTCLTHG
jgi:hypothetical protein